MILIITFLINGLFMRPLRERKGSTLPFAVTCSPRALVIQKINGNIAITFTIEWFG